MRRLFVIALFGFVGLCVVTAGAETLTDTQTFSFSADPGTRFGLKNLVGTVTIEPASGRDLEIAAAVVASDGDADRAAALVSGIDFDVRESDRRIVLVVKYPVDDFRRYYVRADGERGRDRTNLRYQGEKVRLSTERQRGAVDLRVDLTVHVPSGVSVAVANAGGSIEGAGLDNDLDLELAIGRIAVSDSGGSIRVDTGSGAVTIANHRGAVVADTGSGSVSIKTVTGGVRADTGSGRVRISDIVGNINADTGSGLIRIERCTSDDLRADTGSGRVEINDCEASLNLDTGSGDVVVTGLRAGPSLRVDTGSGDVRISGDLGDLRRLKVDTGSGDVELHTVTPPSLRLEANNNGSSIRIELPDMHNVRQSEGTFEALVGAAEGDGEIDTNSGRIIFVMD